MKATSDLLRHTLSDLSHVSESLKSTASRFDATSTTGIKTMAEAFDAFANSCHVLTTQFRSTSQELGRFSGPIKESVTRVTTALDSFPKNLRLATDSVQTSLLSFPGALAATLNPLREISSQASSNVESLTVSTGRMVVSAGNLADATVKILNTANSFSRELDPKMAQTIDAMFKSSAGLQEMEVETRLLTETLKATAVDLRAGDREFSGAIESLGATIKPIADLTSAIHRDLDTNRSELAAAPARLNQEMVTFGKNMANLVQEHVLKLRETTRFEQNTMLQGFSTELRPIVDKLGPLADSLEKASAGTTDSLRAIQAQQQFQKAVIDKLIGSIESLPTELTASLLKIVPEATKAAQDPRLDSLVQITQLNHVVLRSIEELLRIKEVESPNQDETMKDQIPEQRRWLPRIFRWRSKR